MLWSLPFLALLLVIVAAAGARSARPRASRRLSASSTLTALLIGGNWLLYVYAVTSGHILAASFGYYLNPLANVLLGRFVLKERLTRLQWIAVAIAGAGISVLAAGALGQLWISLTLCVSFALYGLLRKDRSGRRASPALAIETALLFPLAIAWLALADGERRADAAARADSTPACCSSSGIVSTTPLLLFTAARQAPAYSTLGMLQFLAPTLQFLIAVAALRRAVHPRPRDRLRRDLGGARALRRRAAALAAPARKPPE